MIVPKWSMYGSTYLETERHARCACMHGNLDMCHNPQLQVFCVKLLKYLMEGSLALGTSNIVRYMLKHRTVALWPDIDFDATTLSLPMNRGGTVPCDVQTQGHKFRRFEVPNRILSDYFDIFPTHSHHPEQFVCFIHPFYTR